MLSCHYITCIIHNKLIFIIGKSHLISNNFPHNFWLIKILPIANAILGLEPFVTGLFPSFYLFTIDCMNFTSLFQTFYSNRKKITLHSWKIFNIVMT